MALNFLLGGSGSGKSTELCRRITKEAKENPDKNYIILVPEQFTLTTQKRYVNESENKAILNVDVLSFKRLAYRVFEELGQGEKVTLEDTGKNMIIRKILGKLDQEKSLEVLNKKINKPGYVDEVKSFITELVQYKISPHLLTEMSENETLSPYLRKKLKDMTVIYSEFLEEAHKDGILAEEITIALAEVIGESKFVKNAVFVFDEFTGFTPVQQVLMEEIFSVADDIYVTLTIDSGELLDKKPELTDLFYLTKKSLRVLEKLANKKGIDIKRELVGKVQTRNSKEIAHLEENLFRKNEKKYKENEIENIKINALSSPSEELIFAAHEIRRMVREEGYCYKDFAIVSGDNKSYSQIAEEIFSDMEIPLFLDEGGTVKFNSVTEMVLAVLEIFEKNFAIDSMLRLIKNTIIDFPEELKDRFEMYIVATALRGKKKWSGKILMGSKKLSSPEELEEFEKLRSFLASALIPCNDKLKDKKLTVREKTEALYNCLSALGMITYLRKTEEYLVDTPLERKLFASVLDLFDKYVAVLGEEKFNYTEFSEILLAGLESLEIAALPEGRDYVTIGDIERTRLSDVKVMFFVGVNDGIVPSNSEEGGILSQLERQMLEEREYELAPTAKERVFIQRFYLYANLTKPSDKLYITYHLSDFDGKAVRPSYIINSFKRMFDGLMVTVPEREDFFDITTPESSLRYFTENIGAARENNAPLDWLSLTRWYRESDDYRVRAERILNAAFSRYNPGVLSRDAVNMIYGSVMYTDVSRLEKYAKCAYAHFLTYGLKLWEKETSDFGRNDFGNLLHNAVESYTDAVLSDEREIDSYEKEEAYKIAREALDKVKAAEKNPLFFETAKNRFISELIEREFLLNIDALRHQYALGKYKIRGCELEFGREEDLFEDLTLSDGKKIKLHGKIDRVDFFENNDEVVVKIIDYKTGNTSFSLDKIINKLQLQLTVYLSAAIELAKREYPNKTILPGGIYYFKLKDLLVDKNIDPASGEFETEMFKQYKLDGITNADNELYIAMDENLQNVSAKSDVVGVSTLKSGELDKRSHINTTEDFNDIMNYVKKCVIEISERMEKGDVSVDPYYESDSDNSCNYCKFKHICGFDSEIPGFDYRSLQKSADCMAVIREAKDEKGGEESGMDN